MNEKFFDSLMTYSREQVLRAISIFLWLSLLFVSFNKFICKLNYETLTSAERLSNYFLTGDYTVLISWLLCLIFVYSVIKYLITALIPSSAYGARLFFKHLTPEEYKIPLLNVYYKKAINAGKDHLKKAVEFEQKKGNLGIANKQKLDLLTGIVLKFIIILCIIIGGLRGAELAVVIFTLLVNSLLLFFLLCHLTSLSGKALVKNLISGIKETDLI